MKKLYSILLIMCIINSADAMDEEAKSGCASDEDSFTILTPPYSPVSSTSPIPELLPLDSPITSLPFAVSLPFPASTPVQLASPTPRNSPRSPMRSPARLMRPVEYSLSPMLQALDLAHPYVTQNNIEPSSNLAPTLPKILPKSSQHAAAHAAFYTPPSSSNAQISCNPADRTLSPKNLNISQSQVTPRTPSRKNRSTSATRVDTPPPLIYASPPGLLSIVFYCCLCGAGGREKTLKQIA